MDLTRILNGESSIRVTPRKRASAVAEDSRKKLKGDSHNPPIGTTPRLLPTQAEIPLSERDLKSSEPATAVKSLHQQSYKQELRGREDDAQGLEDIFVCALPVLQKLHTNLVSVSILIN
jgi:hypothetical protein